MRWRRTQPSRAEAGVGEVLADGTRVIYRPERDGTKLPALVVERPSGTRVEAWYLNGHLHRYDDEPAIVMRAPDGTLVETWFVFGAPYKGAVGEARRITRPDGVFELERLATYAPLAALSADPTRDLQGWRPGLGDPALIPDTNFKGPSPEGFAFILNPPSARSSIIEARNTLSDGSKVVITFASWAATRPGILDETTGEIIPYGFVDRPTLTITRPSGRVIEAWYHGGVLGRAGAPALVLRDPVGTCVETWFERNPSSMRATRRETRLGILARESEFGEEAIQVARDWHDALDVYGWNPGLDDQAIIPDRLSGNPGYWVEHHVFAGAR